MNSSIRTLFYLLLFAFSSQLVACGSGSGGSDSGSSIVLTSVVTPSPLLSQGQGTITITASQSPASNILVTAKESGHLLTFSQSSCSITTNQTRCTLPMTAATIENNTTKSGTVFFTTNDSQLSVPSLSFNVQGKTASSVVLTPSLNPDPLSSQGKGVITITANTPLSNDILVTATESAGLLTFTQQACTISVGKKSCTLALTAGKVAGSTAKSGQVTFSTNNPNASISPLRCSVQANTPVSQGKMGTLFGDKADAISLVYTPKDIMYGLDLMKKEGFTIVKTFSDFGNGTIANVPYPFSAQKTTKCDPDYTKYESGELPATALNNWCAFALGAVKNNLQVIWGLSDGAEVQQPGNSDPSIGKREAYVYMMKHLAVLDIVPVNVPASAVPAQVATDKLYTTFLNKVSVIMLGNEQTKGMLISKTFSDTYVRSINAFGAVLSGSYVPPSKPVPPQTSVQFTDNKSLVDRYGAALKHIYLSINFKVQSDSNGGAITIGKPNSDSQTNNDIWTFISRDKINSPQVDCLNNKGYQFCNLWQVMVAIYQYDKDIVNNPYLSSTPFYLHSYGLLWSSSFDANGNEIVLNPKVLETDQSMQIKTKRFFASMYSQVADAFAAAGIGNTAAKPISLQIGEFGWPTYCPTSAPYCTNPEYASEHWAEVVDNAVINAFQTAQSSTLPTGMVPPTQILFDEMFDENGAAAPYSYADYEPYFGLYSDARWAEHNNQPPVKKQITLTMPK